MVDLSFNKSRLNLLYNFSDRLLGGCQRFCSEILGENDKERRDNICFLFKFLFIDTLHLSYEEALKMEETLKLSDADVLYTYLLTKDYQTEATAIFKPSVKGLMVAIVYNGWDCDRDVAKIYGWLCDYYESISRSQKGAFALENKIFFEELAKKYKNMS